MPSDPRSDARRSRGVETDHVSAPLWFALALAALAGGVDAIGVLRLDGVFVSFMSGNTTQFGIASSGLLGAKSLRFGAIVAAFVSGVVLGEVCAASLRATHRSAVMLGAVALCLVAAAAWAKLELAALGVSLLLALAMGVQNAVVRRAGSVDVALTYVTGTLVHMSRAIAAALMGRGPWRRAAPFAALWLSFALGAGIGGLGSEAGAAIAIAGAAVAAAVLSVASLLPFSRRAMIAAPTRVRSRTP